MRKVLVYSVELQARDFSWFPGAKEFQQKHKDHETEYSYFRFDMDLDPWEDVERELQSLPLTYRKFYEIALDDGEIAGHPVFFLALPAVYELVTEEDGETRVSPEAKNYPLAQDLHSQRVVARSDMVELLRRLNPEITTADDTVYAVGKKKYQILGALPRLDAPEMIPYATGADRNSDEPGGEDSYRVAGWDGRSTLSDSAVQFVKAKHLVEAWYFAVGDKQYKQGAPDFLVSGQLADLLLKKTKGSLYLTPMTLDVV